MARLARPDLPSATELAARVRAGALDPVELAEEALQRWAAGDGELGAFVQVDPAAVRAEARDRAAALRAGGPVGPLHGVPVGVKDLFDVRGTATRAGSRLPAPAPAAADAPAVDRLRRAGAVVLGRTRTHEFAWGLTTQHPALGGTANPWDTARVPGGSSGGSAAAVAAGLVALGLGTDTGCSIRLPAAWCGLVGHKPTYGLVPLAGAVPLAPSLDHGGALARTVADARLALEVLAGTALAPPSGVRGLRLGIVDAAATPSPCTGEVAAAVAAAAGRAAAAGMRPATADLPMGAQLPGLYAAVQAGESLGWHRRTGRWPALAPWYGADVRGRLRACERIEPARVAGATEARQQLRRRLAALFEQVDVLLLPVAGAGPSLRCDPDTARVAGAAVPVRQVVLPWTVLSNLAGLPACSVPAGMDGDGLPIGVQVVGPAGADGRVLDVAAAVQLPGPPGGAAAG